MIVAASGTLVGLPLGVFVGIAASILFLTMLRTVQAGVTFASLMKLAPQVAAVPGLVFGGKWLSGTVVSDIDWQSARPSYLAALTVTTVIVVARPMLAFAAKVTRGFA